jgi:uncharacterized protein YhbP (UPF0306 family)
MHCCTTPEQQLYRFAVTEERATYVSSVVHIDLEKVLLVTVAEERVKHSRWIVMFAETVA